MLKGKFINKKRQYGANIGYSNYLNKSDYSFVETRISRSKPTWNDSRFGRYRVSESFYCDGINKKKATHLGLINKSYEYEE